MRLLRLAIAMLSIGSIACAIAAEPPTQLEVEIGGQRFAMDAGQSRDVEINGKLTRLRVSELPWKQFSESGLRFEYPRHFPWEFEAPGTWTLDGNSALIIVVHADDGDASSPIEALEQMHSELGKKQKPTFETISLATRHGSVKGSAATWRIASTQLRTEAYFLEGKDTSFLLMLQDSLADDGSSSAEFIDMRSRLVESLEF